MAAKELATPNLSWRFGLHLATRQDTKACRWELLHNTGLAVFSVWDTDGTSYPPATSTLADRHHHNPAAS